jgi:hypothetical protein
MSAHDSDSEKAPSHHSESPDQELSEDGRAPERNPSNYRNTATTSSSGTAQKAQKKPKKTAAAPSDGKCIVLHPFQSRETIIWLTFPDDFADDSANVRNPAARQNTDTRPGGGFVNPFSARPKGKKMRWTAENDRKLLLFGLGRDVSTKEYEAIANSFPEKPTEKAVQERLTKLRVQCRQALKDSGIYDPHADRSRSSPPHAFRCRSTGHAAPSPPLNLPPKKKQTRQFASASTSLAQPPRPQGGASNLGSSQQPPPAEGMYLPAHLSRSGSQFSPVPAGRGRSSTFPTGPQSTTRMSNVQSWETMGPQQIGAPQMPAGNMGTPPMGAGQYQPCPSWALPQNTLLQNAPTYPGSGTNTAWNVFQDLPLALTPDQLDFAHVPAGPPVNPTVPDAEEPAEEDAEEDAEGEDEDAEGEDEEEDPPVVHQRELDAKKAQRDAVSADPNSRQRLRRFAD